MKTSIHIMNYEPNSVPSNVNGRQTCLYTQYILFNVINLLMNIKFCCHYETFHVILQKWSSISEKKEMCTKRTVISLLKSLRWNITLMSLLSPQFNLQPYFAPVQGMRTMAQLTKGGRVLQGMSQERHHFLQNELKQTNKNKQKNPQTKPLFFYKNKFWMGPSIYLNQFVPS